MTHHTDFALNDVTTVGALLVGPCSFDSVSGAGSVNQALARLICKCNCIQCQHPVTMQSCHVDVPATLIIHLGFQDRQMCFVLSLTFYTAGSSTEVHGFACHLHCGAPRATKLPDSSWCTASVLLTVHNASDSWAGSFFAGPEASLRLLLAAPFVSEGETPQLMLVVCLMLPVHTANIIRRGS